MNSSWKYIEAGIPKGSILEPLLFVIHTNDMLHNLLSGLKLFADNTSLLSIVNDTTYSTNYLNDDCPKIREWTFCWKVSLISFL